MKYQLELRHLRYFMAVADELHFRKAAEKLFISQPGLSRQIKELEANLQLQLFERHNRKVMLTTAGQYLYAELDRIFKQLDSAFTYTKLLHDGYEGNLNFGYVGSAMHDVIPKFLLSIREQFPKITFDLKEMDNQEQIDDIIHQQIDFGFVRLEKVPRGIEIHPVHQDTFSLVLPKRHPINPTNFKSLLQLKDEPFILFDASYSVSYYNRVMKIFEDSGFVPKISHKTTHANTIYSLVENNFGVSIVPTSMQKGYNMEVNFIELNHLPHRTTLQVIWNSKNANPVLQNIIGLIEEIEID